MVVSLERFLIVCQALRLLCVRSVNVMTSSNLFFFSSDILSTSPVTASMVALPNVLIGYCFLYVSYRLCDSADRPGMYYSQHPIGICFLDVTRINYMNLPSFSGVRSTSSIRLSSSVEYPFQSDFLRLKRLLNVAGCATICGLASTPIRRCCVCGIGSMTDFLHMSEMLDYAKIRFVLYPFFHLALLNLSVHSRRILL